MNILYVVGTEVIAHKHCLKDPNVNLVSLERGAGSCNTKLYDVVRFIDDEIVKDDMKLNKHQELLSKFMLELKRYGLVHENTIYI